MLDKKYTFNHHIDYITEKCKKLIHVLSRSAKVSWGLSHGALKTIYKGAILPLVSHGIPAVEKEHCRRKIKVVHRLINIKIAKVFRTVSHEALCILTGLPPNIIKRQETSELYNIKKAGTYLYYEIEVPVNYKTWPHHADFPGIRPAIEDRQFAWKIYTDRKKMDNNVDSGIVMFQDDEIKHRLRYRLDKKCSNNQAEMLAILKATEKIHEQQKENNKKQQPLIQTARQA